MCWVSASCASKQGLSNETSAQGSSCNHANSVDSQGQTYAYGRPNGWGLSRFRFDGKVDSLTHNRAGCQRVTQLVVTPLDGSSTECFEELKKMFNTIIATPAEQDGWAGPASWINIEEDPFHSWELILEGPEYDTIHEKSSQNSASSYWREGSITVTSVQNGYNIVLVSSVYSVKAYYESPWENMDHYAPILEAACNEFDASLLTDHPRAEILTKHVALNSAISVFREQLGTLSKCTVTEQPPAYAPGTVVGDGLRSGGGNPQ